jgi:hypothetical protein
MTESVQAGWRSCASRERTASRHCQGLLEQEIGAMMSSRYRTVVRAYLPDNAYGANDGIVTTLW